MDTSEYAVVLGTSAKVNKIANGIAIGYKASVTTGSTDGGVAIGSYSVAKTRAGLAGYDPEKRIEARINMVFGSPVLVPYLLGIVARLVRLHK